MNKISQVKLKNKHSELGTKIHGGSYIFDPQEKRDSVAGFCLDLPYTTDI